MRDTPKDQAGQKYWDRAWSVNSLPELWQVDSRSIRAHVERSLFSYISEVIEKYGPSSRRKSLVEVGCARSPVLPLFAKKLGFEVAGIDYSPIGCEQARIMLGREGIQADIYCCDIFSVPDGLAERFEVVVSFGLIEHFSDTAAIVAALSRLVKPGGLVFTNIPNMNGLTGLIQKTLDRDVYGIHVPLTPEAVGEAHERAGLRVVACDYFLSVNFGVVNINSIQIGTFEWWIKKILLAILARMSMSVWWLERFFGPFRPSHIFSPYINCVAVKPECSM